MHGFILGELPVVIALWHFIAWAGVVVTAFTSALVMTFLDLASDPIASTLLGKWTWEDGGSEPQPRNFYAQGIVLYATYGIGIVLNPLLGRTGEIYDAMAMVAGLVITVPIIVAAVSVRESR